MLRKLCKKVTNRTTILKEQKVVYRVGKTHKTENPGRNNKLVCPCISLKLLKKDYVQYVHVFLRTLSPTIEVFEETMFFSLQSLDHVPPG